MRTKFTVVLVIALLSALLVGCASGPELPESDPSIRGFITAVTPGEHGSAGSVLVEAPVGMDELAEYDKASVSITAESTLIREEADGTLTEITFADLAVDQSVEVWFTGAVAESYPVQATAGTLVVRPQ